jgi:hypothetical protein
LSMTKRPKHTFEPPNRGKVAKDGGQADNVPKQNFKWTINRCDRGGQFSVLKINIENFIENVIPKLQDFETMLWSEIEGKQGSHFVQLSDLSKTAQTRLEEISENDCDALFSLRISGKERIWGMRDINVLRIMWWDPDHLVCPSPKKHT